MKNAYLPVFTVCQVKIGTNLKIFANSDYLIDNINNELPIVSVIAQDFNARCLKWAIKTLQIQLAVRLTPHHQQDINNLSPNQFIS